VLILNLIRGDSGGNKMRYITRINNVTLEQETHSVEGVGYKEVTAGMPVTVQCGLTAEQEEGENRVHPSKENEFLSLRNWRRVANSALVASLPEYFGTTEKPFYDLEQNIQRANNDCSQGIISSVENHDLAYFNSERIAQACVKVQLSTDLDPQGKFGFASDKLNVAVNNFAAYVLVHHYIPADKEGYVLNSEISLPILKSLFRGQPLNLDDKTTFGKAFHFHDQNKGYGLIAEPTVENVRETIAAAEELKQFVVGNSEQLQGIAKEVSKAKKIWDKKAKALGIYNRYAEEMSDLLAKLPVQITFDNRGISEDTDILDEELKEELVPTNEKLMELSETCPKGLLEHIVIDVPLKTESIYF
jgi:hypothetical protein